MFDGIPVLDYSAPTLVGITVILLLLGYIVPRKTLNDKAKECKEWKDAYEKERDSRILAAAQTTELLELAKTTHEILDAAFNAPGRHRSPPGLSLIHISEPTRLL